MVFDPGGFLSSARALLSQSHAEADCRTASGRAYYAVYGTLRTRLCRAKGQTPERMFGKSGRHIDLAKGLPVGSSAFKQLAAFYNSLLALRVRSDYEYHRPVTADEAAEALTKAEWIVSRLQSIRDNEFRRFPLQPRQPTGRR